MLRAAYALRAHATAVLRPQQPALVHLRAPVTPAASRTTAQQHRVRNPTRAASKAITICSSASPNQHLWGAGTH